MLLTSSMVATYVALRGANLHIVPGALEQFYQREEVRQIFGAFQHVDRMARILVGPSHSQPR
jgi:hypothetical protein